MLLSINCWLYYFSAIITSNLFVRHNSLCTHCICIVVLSLQKVIHFNITAKYKLKSVLISFAQQVFDTKRSSRKPKIPKKSNERYKIFRKFKSNPWPQTGISKLAFKDIHSIQKHVSQLNLNVVVNVSNVFKVYIQVQWLYCTLNLFFLFFITWTVKGLKKSKLQKHLNLELVIARFVLSTYKWHLFKWHLVICLFISWHVLLYQLNTRAFYHQKNWFH